MGLAALRGTSVRGAAAVVAGVAVAGSAA
jgi:hypothetical protein